MCLYHPTFLFDHGTSLRPLSRAKPGVRLFSVPDLPKDFTSKSPNSSLALSCFVHPFKMAMDQYLLIPFLGGWTSIYQLFWCELQGYKVLTHCQILQNPHVSYCNFPPSTWKFPKMGVPPNELKSLYCNRIFHYKPSIVVYPMETSKNIARNGWIFTWRSALYKPRYSPRQASTLFYKTSQLLYDGPWAIPSSESRMENDHKTAMCTLW